jgi:hypothetical protein
LKILRSNPLSEYVPALVCRLTGIVLMTGNDEKELARIGVKDKVQHRTPNLLRSPRLHFDRDSIPNDAVNPSTCRIVAEADAANRTAIQKCVPSCTAHDRFAVGVMDKSSAHNIRRFRKRRIVCERSFGQGRKFRSVPRPAWQNVADSQTRAEAAFRSIDHSIFRVLEPMHDLADLWHAVFASKLAMNIARANIDVRSSFGLSFSPSPPNFLFDILRAKHFEAASFQFVSFRRVLYQVGLLLQKPQLSLFTASLDRRAR